ncbi:hypothetical protein [Pseudoruegeria sp. SK021]|uniref:hypothetical protein n=1 Tax=Pseudoruegeria sp. SK021 TaxID=1933035 RepID=UPI000A21F3B1|nr:hypothetical protein [Pseudoruegeria sp. SK021]OSP54171.1 hypothetical protein BV911_14040 [Pseudoruegeria sp. SK021]
MTDKPSDTLANTVCDLLAEQSTHVAMIQKLATEHVTQMACMTLAQMLSLQCTMRQIMITPPLTIQGLGSKRET